MLLTTARLAAARFSVVLIAFPFSARCPYAPLDRAGQHEQGMTALPDRGSCCVATAATPKRAAVLHATQMSLHGVVSGPGQLEPGRSLGAKCRTTRVTRGARPQRAKSARRPVR